MHLHCCATNQIVNSPPFASGHSKAVVQWLFLQLACIAYIASALLHTALQVRKLALLGRIGTQPVSASSLHCMWCKDCSRLQAQNAS